MKFSFSNFIPLTFEPFKLLNKGSLSQTRPYCSSFMSNLYPFIIIMDIVLCWLDNLGEGNYIDIVWTPITGVSRKGLNHCSFMLLTHHKGCLVPMRYYMQQHMESHHCLRGYMIIYLIYNHVWYISDFKYDNLEMLNETVKT